jgi:hypothetical protein
VGSVFQEPTGRVWKYPDDRGGPDGAEGVGLDGDVAAAGVSLDGTRPVGPSGSRTTSATAPKTPQTTIQKTIERAITGIFLVLPSDGDS